jgi:hypothetical protein
VFGEVPHANDSGAEGVLQSGIGVRPFGRVVPQFGLKRGRAAFERTSLSVYFQNARFPKPLFVGSFAHVVQEGIFTPVQAHNAGMPAHADGAKVQMDAKKPRLVEDGAFSSATI